MDSLTRLIPLLAGWAADRLIGDPSWLPHPVVGFGKLIAHGERLLNHGEKRVAKGAFLAVTLIISSFCITAALLGLFKPMPVVKTVIESILIFYCLAGTTLCREVKAVFEAADRSLDDGRRQVARIVGRDTANLSTNEVRIAALETLAENMSDGVVAPLFWYMVLGIPGMVAYKMINTLDSMIGYRNDRYRDFGRWAARIDDVANYVPARLTAWLLALTSWSRRSAQFIQRFGRAHASPNSGYPEAAMAGILNCRFGGAHDYFGQSVDKPYIGTCQRSVTTSDMRRAVAASTRTEALMIVIAAVWQYLL